MNLIQSLDQNIYKILAILICSLILALLYVISIKNNNKLEDIPEGTENLLDDNKDEKETTLDILINDPKIKENLDSVVKSETGSIDNKETVLEDKVIKEPNELKLDLDIIEKEEEEVYIDKLDENLDIVIKEQDGESSLNKKTDINEDEIIESKEEI